MKLWYKINPMNFSELFSLFLKIHEFILMKISKYGYHIS